MAFSKIKYAKGDVTIAWKDEGPRSTVTHEMQSGEAPRPELFTALQAFATFVLDIAELDSGWQRDLTIQSVSIGESEALGRGIVVTALKKVTGAHSPIVLNTPFLTELPSSEGGPRLPRYAIDMLDTLEAEAAKFRAGERAQQSLFPEQAA